MPSVLLPVPQHDGAAGSQPPAKRAEIPCVPIAAGQKGQANLEAEGDAVGSQQLDLQPRYTPSMTHTMVR